MTSLKRALVPAIRERAKFHVGELVEGVSWDYEHMVRNNISGQVNEVRGDGDLAIVFPVNVDGKESKAPRLLWLFDAKKKPAG